MSRQITRRQWLGGALAAGAAFTIVPRHVLGGPKFVSPSEKVNVAVVGVGGQGRDNVRALFREADAQIIAVADPIAEKKCMDLFSQIKSEILTMGLESAEMVKHGINSFLSTSIVFANQLADLCEMTGAGIQDVVRGMKTDPRIGQKAYLSPGIGFSGGTLGRDLQVLNRINEDKHGSATLFGIIHRINTYRKQVILDRITRILKTLSDKRIGVLGVTYKPGTSTLRRSLPLEIVDLLIKGCSEICVFDPKADYSELSAKPRFMVAKGIAEAADSADMLVLMTEWKEFQEFNWADAVRKMRRPVFFDTKNFLDRETMQSNGFEYHCIGEAD